MRWRDLWRFLRGPTIEDLEEAQPAIEPKPEDAPNDRRALGDAAKQLLEEPVFQLALARVEDRLYETWRQSATGDSAGREQSYRLSWAVGELRSELRRMVTNARDVNR